MIKTKYTNKTDIENELSDFKIFFAYHSNKIENNETDYYIVKNIFDNEEVLVFTGDTRTLYEIQNQKNCYDFLLDKIVAKEPLSKDFILQIHKTLTNGTYDEIRYGKGERPGEFKKGDYIVGVNEVGSLSEDVEKDIDELLEEINDKSIDDYLTVAAYFHSRFESIHPFADGNGRVGRTLLNYYLMIHDIKPLIIYDEDKRTYYDCLRVYDEKDDIEPLKNFLLYSQRKTWERKKKNSVPLKNYLL